MHVSVHLLFPITYLQPTYSLYLCYLLTLSGGARTRLLEAAIAVSEEDVETGTEAEDSEKGEIRKKRAKKIIKLLK